MFVVPFSLLHVPFFYIRLMRSAFSFSLFLLFYHLQKGDCITI